MKEMTITLYRKLAWFVNYYELNHNDKQQWKKVDWNVSLGLLYNRDKNQSKQKCSLGASE